MRCPNSDECNIAFTTEDWDRGDGVWFESGFSFVYDKTNSWHVPECNLTEEQIEQIEKERNDDISSYDLVSEPEL